MARRLPIPSPPTNSPRVHDTNVSYARVMGERASMNREGLTDPDRTEPVRIRYQDMSRPDRRVRLPRRPRYSANPYVAPECPLPDYLDDFPEPEPVLPLQRRTPGPLRFGTADRPRFASVMEGQPEKFKPGPVQWVGEPMPVWRQDLDVAPDTAYVLEVGYTDGGMGRFEYREKDRARMERMAAREVAMGSTVDLWTREVQA